MPRAERHQLGRWGRLAPGTTPSRAASVGRSESGAKSRAGHRAVWPTGVALGSLALRAVAFEAPCLWALLRPKSLLTEGPATD